MTRSASPLPTPDFQALFESAPDSYLVLTPDLTIVSVNNAYLCATITKREEILGRRVFEVFPHNSDEHSATGVSNLDASLKRVVQNRVADVMAVQKYDIRCPASVKAGKDERYWSSVNTPVFGSEGEVAYILHRIEEVTEFIRLQQQQHEQNQVTQALRTHAEQMEAEIVLKTTEFKQAESALREKEQRLKLAYQTARLGSWELDLTTNTLHSSDTCKANFGLPPTAEHSFQNLIDAIHPDDRSRVNEAIHCAVAEHTDYDTEYRCIWSDGSIHWIIARGGCIYNPDGQPVRIIGVTLNISDRKQAQQILLESEDRYRRLVELSPDTIFVQSEGKFVFINNAGTRLLGAEHPEQLIGRPVLDFFHPDDHLVIKQRIRQLAAGNGVSLNEERFIRLDETLIDVEVTASPFTYQGIPSALVIARDIRDRKRSEQEREQLIEQLGRNLGQREAILRSMSEGLIISDTQGNVLSMNPAALHIHEYKSVEKIQRHLQDFSDTFELHYLDGRLMPIEEWPLSRALKGENFSGYEVHMRRLDTGTVWIGNFGGTPVCDSQGSVILAIITMRDVTEQKRLESELKSRESERESLLVNEQQARQEAEQANRMKDEFLAVLSHELRSPLNAMLGWLKLLRTREFDRATKTRALETIERNARAQAQLIEDLLDISGIIQGKLRLNFQPVSLVNIITAAIDTVRPAADAKDIRLQLMLEPSAELVAGDADRLQQVVWNLLTNAVKFTNKGGRVEIRIERIHSNVEIIVSDTGQGIRPDFLPYVFDRFRQADSSITRSFTGLGLGLAIVRQLVELHGGTVHVESPGEGQGSTFTVKLPLMAVKPKNSEHLRVRPPVGGSSGDKPSRLDGLRILVVDDEADVRELLVCILEDYGAIVTAVETPDEVIRVLTASASHVDVLVSDIGMPKEDGCTLIRRVRRLEPHCGGRIPAVALTAYARAEDRKSALFAGFQSYLTKPVDPAELVEAIALLGYAN